MQLKVKGNPTPEELAAVVVLLLARDGEVPEPDAPVPSAWSDRAALLRGPLPHGPGAWRSVR
jgi:hypothetical protein